MSSTEAHEKYTKETMTEQQEYLKTSTTMTSPSVKRSRIRAEDERGWRGKKRRKKQKKTKKCGWLGGGGTSALAWKKKKEKKKMGDWARGEGEHRTLKSKPQLRTSMFDRRSKVRSKPHLRTSMFDRRSNIEVQTHLRTSMFDPEDRT